MCIMMIAISSIATFLLADASANKKAAMILMAMLIIQLVPFRTLDRNAESADALNH